MTDVCRSTPMMRGLYVTFILAVVATVSGDLWTGVVALVGGLSATLTVQAVSREKQ